MPDMIGQLRIRSNEFDNYWYQFNCRTGEITAFSPPASEWDSTRQFQYKTDGDGHPSNVKEFIRFSDGNAIYKKFAAAWKDIMDGAAPQDCAAFDNYLGRVRDINSEDDAVMCPECGRISLDKDMCQICGMRFGNDEDDGYISSLHDTIIRVRNNPSTNTVDNIIKLVRLAKEGSVGIGEASGAPVFWLPSIHFEEPSRHRFKRMLNCEKFKEYCDGTIAPEWIETQRLSYTNSFDGYIRFIEEYGQLLMLETEDSVLIGDSSRLDKLRSRYVASRVYVDSSSMCDFFFEKTSEYYQELAGPLYSALADRFFITARIGRNGDIDWQFSVIESVATRADVRFELLGITNEMMDDTDIDIIMGNVRRGYGA